VPASHAESARISRDGPVSSCRFHGNTISIVCSFLWPEFLFYRIPQPCRQRLRPFVQETRGPHSRSCPVAMLPITVDKTRFRPRRTTQIIATANIGKRESSIFMFARGSSHRSNVKKPSRNEYKSGKEITRPTRMAYVARMPICVTFFRIFRISMSETRSVDGLTSASHARGPFEKNHSAVARRVL